MVGHHFSQILFLKEIAFVDSALVVISGIYCLDRI
ncbi:hypothetical protein BGP_6434 [Beggiatoa sp. PS]|nr:hypothetical protein BGP_6434 [Beggiatoa sp. PS]